MKVGIIGAMDVEVEHLVTSMSDAQTSTIAGMSFCEGTLQGVEVVVSQCKVGKVNAAMCTQILCDHFKVTHVINTGVAGSLDARINIGDIVVSTDALEHDMDVANLGYALGQVPGLPVHAFVADEAMRAALVRATQEAAPELQVFEGRVASGDQFVRDEAVKQHIISEFGAMCVEMEGAAIAHACYLNNIPFVIVRAISDKADGSDAQDYAEFEVKAAQHCAQITEHALQLL